MRLFDLWAVFIALAAIFAYVNHRCLKFPASSGIFTLALLSSLLLIAIDAVLPSYHLKGEVAKFLRQFDFSTMLLHGMLCFLLFAGAWNVSLEHFFTNRTIIALLAVAGVLISTAVIGLLSYGVFLWLALPVSLLSCFIFGALISPTDPISVLALLKRLKAPKSLEAQIAGESLFNDGVGVVVFFACISLAGLSAGTGVDHLHFRAGSLLWFFLREMGGGILLGLVSGVIAIQALKTVDNRSLELLIILAMVMLAYAVSFWIDVSGPIAVVVTGILLGNQGRRHAMSEATAEHVNVFWEMIDDILNAALFLLLGLELLAIDLDWASLAGAVLTIPIVLVGRLVSVAAPVAAFSLSARTSSRGLIPILTWGGLRGGISVAMVLGLPPFPAKNLLLSCTYATVLFSVLVQSLTMRPLLARFGITAAEIEAEGSGSRLVEEPNP